MEKINSFKDCKIENAQSIYGGRERFYHETNYYGEAKQDKSVYGDQGFIKCVTGVDSWFGRDFA